MLKGVIAIASMIAGLALGGVPSQVLAQHAVNSLTGVALFPEGSLISSRFVTRELRGVNATKDVDFVPTSLDYGLNRDLTLGITLPYTRRRLSTASFATTVEGFGDTIVAAKYRYFFKNYPEGTNQFAVLSGVKFPTGDTDAKAPDGTLLPMPEQLGSGSTDFLVAWSGSWFTAYKRSFHVSVLYKRNTEGDQDFRFGDLLNYNLSVNWLVYHQPYPRPELYLGVELNGEFTRRDESSGVKVANSGAHRIFLSPTFHLFVSRNWNVEGSIQFPVFEDLNGTQSEEDDPRFFVGFRFQYALGK